VIRRVGDGRWRSGSVDRMTDERPTDDHHPGPADLDRIDRDLAGVEAALRRLDDGTYWTDERTGAELSDDLLAADPVARSVS
jgi:RNA polymerase-binding transcription factor DksA